MIFTTLINRLKSRNGIWVTRTFSVIFWIVLWQILAVTVIKSDILLPSPFKVVLRFFELITTTEFLTAVSGSVVKILTGFFTGLISAVILGVISCGIPIIKVLLTPFMSVMKTVPVASFVILALLWFNPESLSSFIAFVMVLPIIYVSVVSGIQACDHKTKEMAKVFRVPYLKQVLYIYLPFAIPFFKSGCSVALGLCWKAGIAAELIGVPAGTIGEQLYFSKIYFEMTDLFAWTITIILISMIFEKLFMFVLDKAIMLYERM